MKPVMHEDPDNQTILYIITYESLPESMCIHSQL